MAESAAAYVRRVRDANRKAIIAAQKKADEKANEKAASNVKGSGRK